MQVAHNVFENGSMKLFLIILRICWQFEVTYFTNLIYISIQFAVGNGDCAPVRLSSPLTWYVLTRPQFVGHNAFLRWKAIQSVAYEEEGKLKFWSDGKKNPAIYK
jgi:hypothetical protein